MLLVTTILVTTILTAVYDRDAYSGEICHLFGKSSADHLALTCLFVVKSRMGKDQAVIIFSRQPDGSLVGKIVDSSGNIVMSKNFGDISKHEMDNVLNAFKQLYPDADILPAIDVISN